MKAIRQFHDLPIMLHMGVRSLYHIIRQRYFWQGMKKDIDQHRKNCKTWGSQRVHPKITLFGNRGGNLKNHLIHYYCHSIADLIKKLDGYSSGHPIQ